MKTATRTLVGDSKTSRILAAISILLLAFITVPLVRGAADCPDIPPPECGSAIAAGRWNLTAQPTIIRITGTETDSGIAVEEFGDHALDWTLDGELTQEWLGGAEENYIDITCEGSVTGKGHDRITGEFRKTQVPGTYCEEFSNGTILGENPIETHNVTLERTYDITGRVIDSGKLELRFVFTSGSLRMEGQVGDWVDCVSWRDVFSTQADVSLDGEVELLEVVGNFDPSQPISVTFQPRESEKPWIHQFLSRHKYEDFQVLPPFGLGRIASPDRYGPFLQLEGPEVEWAGPVEIENVSPVVLKIESQSPKYYLQNVTAENVIVATVDWRNAPEPHEVEFDYDGEKTIVSASGDRVELALDMGRPGATVTAIARGGELRSAPFPLALFKVPVPGWAAPVSGFSGTPGIQYETTLDWPISLETTRTLKTISLFTGIWGIKGSASSELKSKSHSSGVAIAGNLNAEVSLKLAGRNYQMTMAGPNTSTLDCETLSINGEGTVNFPRAEWEATINPFTLLPGLQPAVASLPGFIGNFLNGFVNGFGLKADAGVTLSGTAGYESQESELKWVSGRLDGTISGGLELVVLPPPVSKLMSVVVGAEATGCLGFQVAPEFFVDQLGGTFEVNGLMSVFGKTVFSGSEEFPFGDGCGGAGLRLAGADPSGGSSSSLIESTAAIALGPNGMAAAAWSEIPAGQSAPSGDIHVQIFDGQAWQAPFRITDDIQADSGPELAFDANGNLLVCFQRNPSVQLPVTWDDMATFFSGLELAYTLIDPANGTTLETGFLTQNVEMDSGPTLRTDANGTIHLFWQRTGTGTMIGTTENPASILSTIWTNGQWSAESVAANNLTGVYGWHPAAYSETESVIGIVCDLDGDLANADDREIHLAQKTQGTWQPTVRITQNTVEDSAVLAGYDATGVASLAWKQGALVVGLTGDWTGEPQVWFPADLEIGPGFALGRMFSNAQGMALIWPEANDLFVSATFGGDALPGSDWRAPEKVAETPETESSLDAGFTDGENFRYVAGSRVSNGQGAGFSFGVGARSILPQFPNQPPVARPDLIMRDDGQPALISFSDLLSNDHEPEGQALQVLYVDSVSARGAMISIDDETIIYDIPFPEEEDSFTYRIADGRGGYADGLVTVRVVPEPIGPPPFMISEIAVEPNGMVRIRVLSATNSYVVLYRGSEPDEITNAIGASLSLESVIDFIDPGLITESAARFYVARNIPLIAPLDHDGDGIDDLTELAHPAVLDPFNPSDADGDADNDGLTNRTEINAGTNPASEDSDEDGIDDKYELDHPTILDPLDPDDAAMDPDGDGRSNLREYEDGTDPEVMEEEPNSNDLYPGANFPFGGGTDLETTDVDNDGVADLVSFGGGVIYVTMGNLDGSFAPPNLVNIAGGPFGDITLARLNADNFPDVVFADQGNNRVEILFGDGLGGFASNAKIDLGVAPYRAVLAHVNSDAHLDIVTINQLAFSLSVLLGNGDGTFQPPTTVATQTRPTDAVAVLLNDDEHPDLVVTISTGGSFAAVFLNNGDGTFAPRVTYPTSASPQRIATADVNGDTFADIITSNQTGDGISVLLGNGDGTLQGKVDHPTGDNPRGLLLTDLDGDLDLDVLVAHVGANFHASLLNNGTGIFTAGDPIYTSSGTYNCLLVDVDRDGHRDIISQLNTGVDAMVSRGLAGGGFDTREQYSYALGQFTPRDFEVADVNGDGRPDVLVSNQRSNTVDILIGQAGGGLSALTSIPIGEKVEGLALARLNPGPALDLAIVTQRPDFSPGNSSNKLYVLHGSGAGDFTLNQELELSAQPNDVLAGDFDGDGQTDLMVAYNATGEIQVFNNSGTSFSGQAPLDLGTSFGGGSNRRIAGDFNDDGLTDLAVAVFDGQGVIKIVPGNSGAPLAVGQVITPLNNGNAQGLALADVTGDGIKDLLTDVVTGSLKLVYYPGSVGGLFGAEQTLLEGFSGSIELQDLNGDGLPDLLSGTTVRLAQSGGGYGEPKNYFMGSSALETVVADMNGDGRPDLIAADDAADAVEVLLHR